MKKDSSKPPTGISIGDIISRQDVNVTMIYTKKEKCEKCGDVIFIRYKPGMKAIDYPLCKKCRDEHPDLALIAKNAEKVAARKTRRL